MSAQFVRMRPTVRPAMPGFTITLQRQGIGHVWPVIILVKHARILITGMSVPLARLAIIGFCRPRVSFVSVHLNLFMNRLTTLLV